ncbi:hypothetical protein MTR67_014695 [Solanum verrucosum]|uniref:Uncharacterized protein n=1 Tax=Solanum verrucosum TaxID=315347 RepID=A0AAF0TPY1_SOLVR|nr:hypothetical protein MTR67_014695 [Solanum verrucosum]
MCYSSQVAAHLDWFGWCTWDAFYKNVNPQGNKEGLERYKYFLASLLRRSISLATFAEVRASSLKRASRKLRGLRFCDIREGVLTYNFEV